MSKLTLNDLKKNDVFKIVDFDKSCENLKNRLQGLGIHKNQMGLVLNKPFFGPIEIDVDDRKIAIGRGMSKKIYVKKIKCPIF